MAELRYAVVLEPAQLRGRGYTVTVPALPQIVTQGDTLDEALFLTRAIELSLLARLDEGMDIPP
jgi:predicted RNase H-like HicB family nuclease